MATEEDHFQQRSDAFMDWLHQQDGVAISPKIALVDRRDQGRGRAVIAVQDIDDDEMLFKIPRHLIMDVKTSDLREHIPTELSRLESWQQTVLVMIYESGKGESSLWYPYWQILPDRIDNILINWSDEELRELQGSAVLNRVGKEEANQALETFMLPVVKKHADLFGTYADAFKGSSAKEFLLDLANRRAGLMMASAFDVEEDSFLHSDSRSGDSSSDEDDEGEEHSLKGMVPLADMLNASGAKHNASISYGERELMMSSIKPIKAGEEIFNTYGDLPRSDLLRRYGYINDDYLPFDVVEISLSRLVEIVASKFNFSQKEINLRTQGDSFGLRHKSERLLEKSRPDEEDQSTIFEDAYDIAKVPSAYGFFPLPLIYTIWLLVADDAEVQMVKNNSSSEPRMSLKVAWVLREVLLGRQKDYPTTIDEDRKVLEKLDLPARFRLAVEVRLGEKLILHEALEYFRRMDEKVPGGLGNWEKNSPLTTYLPGEEIVADQEATGHEQKRRRVK